MPISPAAQKFHRFIRRSAFDNSVSSSECSLLNLMWGMRHIADRNQHTAEPHAVTIMAVSIGDFIITPEGSGSTAIILPTASGVVFSKYCSNPTIAPVRR